MRKGKIGVVDIGSNTIRLVIYEHSKERGLSEIQNIKTVARLRTYLQDDKKLAEEGIGLLEKILLSFQEILSDFKTERVYATATASVRQAVNGPEIIDRLKKTTGFEIDILSEEEEAFYGFLAVAHSLPVRSGITIDIGGGSTEITYFDEKELQASHSFPFGVVSLKQDFMDGDRLPPANKQKLIQFVTEQLATLDWLKGKALPVIGIGGSARNIAHIDQRMKDYPISGVHQYKMSAEDLDQMSKQFEGVTVADMRKVEGLSNDRADIILLAMEVFRALLKTVGTDEFIFSRKGLREGIMINAIMQSEEHSFDKNDVFRHSFEELAKEYGVNRKHSEFMKKMTGSLYQDFCEAGYFTWNEDDSVLISRAASLFNLGEYIDSDGASEHTFYLLANRSIDGLLHKDRVRLALVASYKNSDLYKRYTADFSNWFSEEELRKYRDFGRLLKFIYALNVSKRQVTQQIELQRNNGTAALNVSFKGNSLPEEYQAERQKKHIDKIVKGEIPLVFRHQ